MSFLKRNKFPSWTIPLLILGISVAAYGILAYLQGYYWDDWGFAWLAHVYGAEGLLDQLSATGRPWLGYFHIATDWLVGGDPTSWQVFGILCRSLSALSFLWMLKTVWPNKTRLATWAALLFLVYPGFSQQFIAITYSHVFIIQAAFFMSMGLTVLAIRKPKRVWIYHTAAILLSAFNLFMVEYLVVLELLRPILAWWVIREQNQPRRTAWGKLFKNWLPYILLLTGYLYWRVFILSNHLYQPLFFGTVTKNPLAAIRDLAGKILSDMFKTSLLAWGKVFEIPSMTEFGRLSTLLYATLVVGGTIILWFYLSHFHPKTNPGTETGTTGKNWQWMLTGLVALFLAGWPFWIAQLEVQLVHPNDRFTLAFMPGVSILFAGVIELISKRYWLKTGILAMMISLAVGLQFQNANLFRRDWKEQQSFFWQLTWRVPALEPGTTVLSADILPMSYSSDDSLTAPLNWIYAPDLASYDLPYLMLFASERSWFTFEKGQPIQRPYSPASFKGNTTEMVVIHYNPPGCLRILDPEYDQGTPLLPPDTLAAMPLSDTSRIILNPKQAAAPPASLFSPEPIHGWCYYFEKAELARQQGDWVEVARLGDIGFSLADSPNDASEYVVFIEGYANAGRWDDASAFTLRALEITPLMQPMLCNAWQRIAGLPGNKAAPTDMLAELACETP